LHNISLLPSRFIKHVNIYTKKSIAQTSRLRATFAISIFSSIYFHLDRKYQAHCSW